MKIISVCLIFFLYIGNVSARNIGETEITTEDGIEVFQDKKYYLLKKNVVIQSDNFNLLGDIVKIHFEKDLYDISIIDAIGNVKLESSLYKIFASGPKLIFTQENQEVFIEGKDSKLLTKDTEMYSDGEITVNNINGNFLVSGSKSIMIAENIYIEGNYIEGTFEEKDQTKSIIYLKIIDDNLAYIKTEDTEMYAKNINYTKDNSLIILNDSVKIVRDGEVITGDYGTLDTSTNSYKVKSNETNKVKVIIKNNE